MKPYRVEEVDVHPKAEDSFFELGEDEIILDTDWRSANRAVLLVATPFEYRCGSTDTSDGEPCEREVDAIDETCHDH